MHTHTIPPSPSEHHAEVVGKITPESWADPVFQRWLIWYVKYHNTDNPTTVADAKSHNCPSELLVDNSDLM